MKLWIIAQESVAGRYSYQTKTLRHFRRDAIDAFIKHVGRDCTWDDLKKQGYKCVKVKIEPLK